MLCIVLLQVLGDFLCMHVVSQRGCQLYFLRKLFIVFTCLGCGGPRCIICVFKFRSLSGFKSDVIELIA